jgi:hypothetical protein
LNDANRLLGDAVKATEIKEGDILYWDPSNKWAGGHTRFDTPKVKVLDPVLRHWKWDFHEHSYKDSGKPTLMGTRGILVEVQDEPGTYAEPRQKIATLNALRGPYERVARQVAEALKARVSAFQTQQEQNRSRNERMAAAIGQAAGLDVKATGLYPFTTIQVPIAEFEAMVAALAADGWRYEA